MNQALYRKYRPITFDDVYGQEPIVKILKNAVKDGSFSHAYLFSGPRGTGKTSLARILAKSINCDKNKEGNPDNACNNCKLINENKALDILEIDAASHTQVDNIREVIIERAHFAPTNLKYKVYIIDEAHMLSKSSFNALLKTLEEPPAHTVLILATTEINKIPTTIISRCQRFDFKRINMTDLLSRLKYIAKSEGIEITDKALELIAQMSEGGFRDAISLLDQVSAQGQKIDVLEVETLLGFTDTSMLEDLSFALAGNETSQGLEIVQEIKESGFDVAGFIKNFIEYQRKLLLASVSGTEETNFSVEGAKKAKEILSKTSTEEIIRNIDILIETEKLYRNAYLPELSLEVSIIKITQTTPVQILVQPEIPKDAVKEPEKAAPAKKVANNHSGMWQQLLMEVKQKNNSIHAFLRVCEPDFEGNTVCLYFPYKFHKERIEESKNRRVVEESMKKVYGSDYKIKCVIKHNPKVADVAAPPKNDDLLKDALEIFGGEVVE